MAKVVFFTVDIENKKVLYDEDSWPKDLEEAFDLIDSELHVEEETSNALMNEVSDLRTKVADLEEDLYEAKQEMYAQ